MRALFLPCSLLLSPLCDVCPPLEGPGVPPERVDAVSSWSLFQEGYGAKKIKRLKSEMGKKCPDHQKMHSQESGTHAQTHEKRLANTSPELFPLSR